MTQVMKYGSHSEIEPDALSVKWWCPGCDSFHVVPVSGSGTQWEFDGDLEQPTLNPSVLVFSHETLNAAGEAFIAGGGHGLTDAHRTSTPRCHTFIHAGRIEFLSDCTHELAGQTVPMREIEQ